jgi:pilus assembly protein CpaB
LSRRVRIGILIAIVGIGLAAAGVFALSRVIRQSLAPLPPPTPQPEITVKAVVASHDLPFGSVLRSGDIKSMDVPVELAPTGVVTDLEQVIGRITKVNLLAGEILMDQNLANPTNVNHDLGFIIGDNQVLMAFPANDLMSSLSVLQRGDLVDILVSITQEVPLARENTEGVVIQEGETVSRVLTFNAMQRLEVTAMVVDIIKQDEPTTPQLPTGGTPQPQPTPSPSQIKTRAYLLALSPQDALLLKHLLDTGALFDFVLRAPTSNQIFDLQTVTSDYLIDRYELSIPK